MLVSSYGLVEHFSGIISLEGVPDSPGPYALPVRRRVKPASNPKGFRISRIHEANTPGHGDVLRLRRDQAGFAAYGGWHSRQQPEPADLRGAVSQHDDRQSVVLRRAEQHLRTANAAQP